MKNGQLYLNYLRAWSPFDHKEDDLDTAVNAFTYLDADMSQRPTKKYTRRCHMRRIKAEPAVKDVEKGSINAREYIGAALKKLASQCKALLLRVKRGNAPAASTECPHGKIPISCPDCTRDNEAESNGPNPT